MADMGHYSLWTVFKALNLTSPEIVEPTRSHVCDFNGVVPYRINNDFSFPMASTVRFRYPANGNRPAVDLTWYDGGMRPPVPEELVAKNRELPQEGMMFIGDKGKILTGFRIENPELISGSKVESVKTEKRENYDERAEDAVRLFVNACKTGKQYPGSFPEAEHLNEAVNLYAAALRTNRILKYDGSKQQITNTPESNKYLTREYRKGWELPKI